MAEIHIETVPEVAQPAKALVHARIHGNVFTQAGPPTFAWPYVGTRTEIDLLSLLPFKDPYRIRSSQLVDVLVESCVLLAQVYIRGMVHTLCWCVSWCVLVCARLVVCLTTICAPVPVCVSICVLALEQLLLGFCGKKLRC